MKAADKDGSTSETGLWVSLETVGQVHSYQCWGPTSRHRQMKRQACEGFEDIRLASGLGGAG